MTIYADTFHYLWTLQWESDLQPQAISENRSIIEKNIVIVLKIELEVNDWIIWVHSVASLVFGKKYYLYNHGCWACWEIILHSLFHWFIVCSDFRKLNGHYWLHNILICIYRFVIEQKFLISCFNDLFPEVILLISVVANS